MALLQPEGHCYTALYWDKVQRIFEGHQRGYIRYLEGVHRIFGWVLIFERILGKLYIAFHHTHTAFSGVKKTRTAMEPFTGNVHDTVVADEDGQKASLGWLAG